MSWPIFESVGNVVGGLVGGVSGGLVGAAKSPETAAYAATGAVIAGTAGLVTTAGAIDPIAVPVGAGLGAIAGGSKGFVEGFGPGASSGWGTGGEAGKWLDDKIAQMVGADEEADKAPASGDQTDACSNCQPPPPDPDDDSNDPNKVDHVFGEGQLQKHKLEDVLKSYGGDKVKAYRALQAATRNAVGPNAGRFQTTVSVNNYNVTVRGATVNGVPRISTAFIP